MPCDGGIALSSGDVPLAGRALDGAAAAFRRATRPDLVVSFLSYFSVLTAASAARIGARVVFNQQTPMSAFLTDRDYHWRRPWHRRVFSWASRYGYRKADAIVATSKGVADDLVAAFGVPAGHIHVVHNPVDLDAIAAAAGEADRSGACNGAGSRRSSSPPAVSPMRRTIRCSSRRWRCCGRGCRRSCSSSGSGDREASLRALVAEKQLGHAS